MILLITENSTIAEMQQAFQAHFPHLKIEFYTSPHQEGEGSSVRHTLDRRMKLVDSVSNLTTGSLSLDPKMSAAELEERFAEQFGLNVQVFRRSGQVWLQTITLDSLSLSELNAMAAEREDEPEESKVDPMDRQELE